MNDGGPAFPFPCVDGQHDLWRGMTLRDWFAGQALTRWCISDEADPENVEDAQLATECYRFADAMIAAREAK